MRRMLQTQAHLSAASLVAVCVHCGNEVPSQRAASRFCCAGCESVYSLLQERGLGRYYDIRAKARPLRPVVTVERSIERSAESYSYLDDPEFLALYETRDSGKRSMQFYLDGVHCAACVWLTERVGEFVPGVDGARLNLGDSVIRVTLREYGSFAAVAREFARLGYPPHPVRADEGSALSRQADHRLLARTGVAGACAGNIMLLAVSLYAGAEGGLAETFRWVSFALTLPVLLFSAQPFYQGAWAAFRGRRVSIDLPIALGIALGGLSSVYNLLTGSPYLYFDSLSMLVFLMLASRYMLLKAQRSAANSTQLIRFLTPSTARVWSGGRFRDVPVERVRPGDEIEILTGDVVPVDGVVLWGTSWLDNSLLSGESAPVSVSMGDVVFAGTVNQALVLRIRATASGAATRVGRTLKAVQEDLSRKASIVTFADRVARIFVAAVLIAVVIVFFVGLRQGLDPAVNLALALSIVTCPCAFALATPLALSISIGRCAKEGVLIRGSGALERLSRAREVIFDKTGTLTCGKYQVESWVGNLPMDAIVALECQSRHPLAKAIVEHFWQSVGTLPEVRDFKEVLGEGVSGVVLGQRIEIKADGADTGVWVDGLKVGSISLRDMLREGSEDASELLAKQGYRIGILSGDSATAVKSVADRLGLPQWRWMAELSPEQKRAEVLKRPLALMVGDGANDAAALAAAYVSVAVHSGVEVSLRSADVYSRIPGIRAVPPLLIVARETMRVIRRNFALSLVYNAIGIVGVALGWVTPLFAAVLMPMSAITVFASSLIGTRRLRRALVQMRG